MARQNWKACLFVDNLFAAILLFGEFSNGDFKLTNDPKLSLSDTARFGGSVDQTAVLDFVDAGRDLILVANPLVSELIMGITVNCRVNFDEDSEAMVIDYIGHAVSETEGDHTLIASDDFIKSNVILGEKENVGYIVSPQPRGFESCASWLLRRHFVPFANAPYKNLTVVKAIQNWVQYEENVFRFSGGDTQFPQGTDDQLASVIPITNSIVTTALDTGGGVLREDVGGSTSEPISTCVHFISSEFHQLWQEDALYVLKNSRRRMMQVLPVKIEGVVLLQVIPVDIS